MTSLIRWMFQKCRLKQKTHLASSKETQQGSINQIISHKQTVDGTHPPPPEIL